MLDEENLQQDANVEESSAPQNSPQGSQTGTPAESEAQSASKDDSQLPFHEHPRFKELIDERKQYAEQLSAYEKRMQDMEARYQADLQKREAPQKQVNPFVAKLREIDPAYAEYIESLEARANKVETLEERLQALDRKNVVSDYESTINKLHESNKVPSESQARIKKELDYLAMTNPKLSMKDLPQIYKQILDEHTKFVDSIKRSERASYVADKSKDSAAPKQAPRGNVPSTKGKTEFTGDRETDMALISKRVLAAARSGKDF